MCHTKNKRECEKGTIHKNKIFMKDKNLNNFADMFWEKDIRAEMNPTPTPVKPDIC